MMTLRRFLLVLLLIVLVVWLLVPRFAPGSAVDNAIQGVNQSIQSVFATPVGGSSQSVQYATPNATQSGGIQFQGFHVSGNTMTPDGIYYDAGRWWTRTPDMGRLALLLAPGSVVQVVVDPAGVSMQFPATEIGNITAISQAVDGQMIGYVMRCVTGEEIISTSYNSALTLVRIHIYDRIVGFDPAHTVCTAPTPIATATRVP